MLGAIIGDIVGSRWEFNPTNDYNFEWLSPANSYTDDTICTVAVADALLHDRDFGESIHDWCNRYRHPMGGYGGRFAQWVASNEPKPYGSFGNGAAMRVSPVAYWYEDKNQMLKAAEATAACSHNHREGIKGAQTVAVAIHTALELRESNGEIDEFGIDYILRRCTAFSNYDIEIDKADVINKFDETCQGTVPVALWIIGESTSFEDAVRKAVSLGADADTLGAIVGSIAEAIWGIPKEFIDEIMQLLPADMKRVLLQFYRKCGRMGMMSGYGIKAEKDDILLFADKYLTFFRDEFGKTPESYYRFFDNEKFPEECRTLGFEMDCGHSFAEAYGAAWNDVEILRRTIEKVSDINIIGSGLFSQWRYFNHWSSPSHADADTKEWFILLFERLKVLCKK